MDYPTDSSTFSPTQVHGHEDYEHIFNHDHDQHQLVRDLDRRDELKGETGEDVDEGEGRISAYPQEPPDHEVRTLDENNKNRYGHHEGLEAHGEIHRHELHHELGQEQGEDETGNRHNYGYYYGQEAEHGDDYEQEYGQQQREVEQDDEVQQRGQPSESDDVLDVTQLTSPVPESLSASTSTPTSSALSHPALTTASTSAPAPAPQQAPEIEIAPGSTSLPAEASSPLFPARISASAIDGAEEMSIPPNLRLGRHAQGHMKTPGAGYTQIPSDTETHVHPLHFSAQAVQTTLETGQALETDSHVLAAQITADVAEEQAAAEEETETAVQARQILLEAANLSLPNDMDALREEVRRLREQLRISQQHQHEHGFGNVDGNEHEHPGDKDHVQHEENELQEQQEQQEQQERLEEIAEIAEDKLGGNQGLMQVEHIVEGSQVGVDQDAIALDRFDFGQAVSGAEEQSEEHGEVDGEEVEMEEENEEDAVAAAAAAASMDDYIAQHLAALGQAQEDPPHPHVEDHSINQHEQPDPDYENQHDLTQSLHDHQIQHEHDHHGHTDLNDQHQHQHIHTDHPDERYHSDFLDSTGLVGVGDYPAVGFDHLAAAASEYDQLVVNHQQFSQSHEDQALGTADGLQSAHHNQSPYGQNESGKPDQRMKKSKKKKLDSASVSEHARRQIDSGVASRGESTLLNAPMATSSEDHKKKRTTGKRKRGVTGVVPAHSDSHILVDPQLLYEYDPRQAEHATHEMYSHEAYQHHQQHHEQLMLQQSQERENKVIVPISEETGKRVSQRDRMDQLSKAVRQRMRQELHIGEEDPLPGPEQGGPHWMLGPRHPNNIEWHEHIAEVVLDGLLRGEMHFNVPDSQLNIESAKNAARTSFLNFNKRYSYQISDVAKQKNLKDARRGRRWARKDLKMKKRFKAAARMNEIIPSKVLRIDYQSSENSSEGEDSGLAPGEWTRAANLTGRVDANEKVLEIKTPRWRSAELNAMYDRIDAMAAVLVMEIKGKGHAAAPLRRFKLNPLREKMPPKDADEPWMFIDGIVPERMEAAKRPRKPRKPKAGSSAKKRKASHENGSPAKDQEQEDIHGIHGFGEHDHLEAVLVNDHDSHHHHLGNDLINLELMQAAQNLLDPRPQNGEELHFMHEDPSSLLDR